MQAEDYAKLIGMIEVTSGGVARFEFAEASFGAQSTVDIVHTLIHRGNCFGHSSIHAAVGVNSSFDHLFYVNSFEGEVHLIVPFVSNANGETSVELYEDTQVSSVGTVQRSINRNRYAPDSSYGATWEGAVVSSAGLQLAQRNVPGGNKSGAAADFEEEWVLRQGVYYLVRATNKANQASDISLELRWVELHAH